MVKSWHCWFNHHQLQHPQSHTITMLEKLPSSNRDLYNSLCLAMILPSNVSWSFATCEICFSSFLMFTKGEKLSPNLSEAFHLSMILLPSVLSSSSGPNFPPWRSSTSLNSAWYEQSWWNWKKVIFYLKEMHFLQSRLIVSLKESLLYIMPLKQGMMKREL